MGSCQRFCRRPWMVGPRAAIEEGGGVRGCLFRLRLLEVSSSLGGSDAR